MEKSKDHNKSINEEYIQKIKRFGLSTEEAIVYLSLLKRGTRGEVVGRIKDELEIGRTTIYAIMERLDEKGWVTSEEISSEPRRVKYIARPPLDVLKKIIKEKEDELLEMKNYSLFIGDKLDQTYQGAKKLTIDTIHVGGYKYLKPLMEQGWKIKSEVIEHEEALGRLVLDYELKGRKGIPKDCGLVIFNFDKNIEADESIIRDAINIFKIKTEYEIRRDKIPGFEDLKLEDTTFNDYPGINVYIKLKFKKKWWLAGKEAILPIKKRIFLIHGNKDNFQVLMENTEC